MKQITYTELYYKDFDRLVQETYELPNYKCIAENEWNNDSSYTFQDVNGIVDEGDEKALAAKTFSWQADLLLNDLVRRGKLLPGNYIIEVCW